MPLKAKINGQVVRAPLVAPDEWAAIQNQRPLVEMCCCTAKGYMRVRLGTQHFVHLNRPDDCIWQPESPEHEALKTLVMRTLADAGWDADIEVPGPDRRWIADVLATKNRAKLAFEIQLSPITHAELFRRHRAYAECGVRGCWFVKGPVGRDFYGEPSTDEPVFWLRQGVKAGDGTSDFMVSINPQHILPVDEAVRALLRKQFQWCDRKRIRKREWVSIIQIPSCWFCGKAFHTYEIEESFARCDGSPERGRFVNEKRLLEPAIVGAVEKFLDEHGEYSFEVAFPALRRHPMFKREEVAFSCVHCGGAHSWRYDQWFWYRSREPIATIPIRSEDHMEEGPHWCHSKNQDFCCLHGT